MMTRKMTTRTRYYNNVDTAPGTHVFYYGTMSGKSQGRKADFYSAMNMAHRKYRIIREDKENYGYGDRAIRMTRMVYEVFE